MDGGFTIDPLIAKGAGGILGGAVALTLDIPKTRADFARRLFVSAVCGLAFPGPTLRYFSVPVIDATGKPDVELILAVGLLWGLAGWFVLGLVIRTFTNWRDRGASALDAAKDVRDTVAGKDKP